MTFYDQDDGDLPISGAGPGPEPSGADGFDDPDIWSMPEDPAAQAPAPAPVEPTAAAGRGPRRPVRRGPRRPGRPGAVPTEPVSGQVPLVVDPHVADDHGGYADEYEDDGYEYVDLPRESRVPRWVAALLVLALVAGLAVGGVAWWYQRQVNPPGGQGDEVTVVVPEGSSSSQIGDLLARDDVVTSSALFNFHVGRKGAGPWQAGRYTFRTNSSFDQAIEVLDAGPGAGATDERATVTIPEGLTLDKALARIEEAVPHLTVADLQAALDSGNVPSSLKPADATSYEGLLFPATYKVSESEDAVAALSMMTAEMVGRLDTLDVPSGVARIKEGWGLELTTYDVVKVASIVQAEAASPEEMAKVATVIYNRLVNADGRFPYLGIDAIDRYGAERAGMDLSAYWETTEPYNSRGVAGLPPTPIGQPGEAALEAAMNPAEGNWLWYVLSDPGVHVFVHSQAEFDQAKAICRDKGLC